MTSVLTGVNRLTRPGTLAPDKSNGIPARSCGCNGTRLVFASVPGHCHKCGRDTRVLSPAERADLGNREGWALLDAAITHTGQELDVEISERTGCDGFIELLRETYWLADALRSDWVPEP